MLLRSEQDQQQRRTKNEATQETKINKEQDRYGTLLHHQIRRLGADRGHVLGLDPLGHPRDTVCVTSPELLELVTVDPAICHGQPCIKGTRVLVTVILDALAAGLTVAEIIREYPSLSDDGVRAAAAYGAWLAKQEVHLLSPGA